MSVPSWLPSGDGTDLVTAYKLHALQGSVVHLNIFSLPEISLPALRIADSVRLRSVRFHRDSKGSNPCLVASAHPLQVAPFNLCWRRCCELEPFLDQLILPSLLLQCPQRCFRCFTNSGCSQCRCRYRLTTMYHNMYQLKFRMGVQCLDSDKADHSAPKSAVDWKLREVPLSCSLSLCRVSSKIRSNLLFRP